MDILEGRLTGLGKKKWGKESELHEGGRGESGRVERQGKERVVGRERERAESGRKERERGRHKGPPHTQARQPHKGKAGEQTVEQRVFSCKCCVNRNVAEEGMEGRGGGKSE